MDYCLLKEIISIWIKKSSFIQIWQNDETIINLFLIIGCIIHATKNDVIHFAILCPLKKINSNSYSLPNIVFYIEYLKKKAIIRNSLTFYQNNFKKANPSNIYTSY